MRLLSGLIAATLLILLPACNGNDIDVTETETAEEPFRSDTMTAEVDDGTLTEDLLFDLIDAGLHPSRMEGRPHILEQLPEPQDITVEPRDNPHIPEQVDSLRTYHFDGVDVVTYDITGDPDVIITGITVTSSEYRSPDGIRVGMTRGEVEDIMMTPDEEEDGRWTYHFATEATNTFQVYFENDRVERIEWGFYFD